jgi:hypothetical protein
VPRHWSNLQWPTWRCSVVAMRPRSFVSFSTACDSEQLRLLLSAGKSRWVGRNFLCASRQSEVPGLGKSVTTRTSTSRPLTTSTRGGGSSSSVSGSRVTISRGIRTIAPIFTAMTRTPGLNPSRSASVRRSIDKRAVKRSIGSGFRADLAFGVERRPRALVVHPQQALKPEQSDARIQAFVIDHGGGLFQHPLAVAFRGRPAKRHQMRPVFFRELHDGSRSSGWREETGGPQVLVVLPALSEVEGSEAKDLHAPAGRKVYDVSTPVLLAIFANSRTISSDAHMKLSNSRASSVRLNASPYASSNANRPRSIDAGDHLVFAYPSHPLRTCPGRHHGRTITEIHPT